MFKNSEWKKVNFSDAVSINPRESLKKGTLAKKVAMSNITEHTKKIYSYDIEEYKSGPKFRQGDTLFARITPSLENGKTSKVNILEEDELGFGSTELIVMREKSGMTDGDFIYYLTRWDGIRGPAIKSMTGTSGRQRVQNSIFDDLLIELPPLEEQKLIANILSSFDDKIENNNAIIANLEEQAQAVFKSWFVNFEPFQNREFISSELGDIPENWQVKQLSNLFEIKYGKNLPTKKLEEKGYPVFGGNGQIGFYHEYLFEEPKILISCRGAASGKVVVSLPYSFITNNSLIMNELDQSYFHYYRYLFSNIEFENYATGSAQPQITIANIKDIKVCEPNENIINKFNKILNPIFNMQLNLQKENIKLVNLRDTLLPKLMSGEIRVEEAVETE